MDQIILRLLPEKKIFGLDVKEGKPFREWLFLHPEVYEASIGLRLRNYEEIVGIVVV